MKKAYIVLAIIIIIFGMLVAGLWAKNQLNLKKFNAAKNTAPSNGAVANHTVAATGPLDQWNWRNPLPTGNRLGDVEYGNGTFVAVGDCGTILTSPDGTTWTSRSALTMEKK